MLIFSFHKTEIKNNVSLYYLSFSGIVIGILFYFLIILFLPNSISLFLSIIFITISGWYISWKNNLYILLGSIVVILIVLFNIQKLDNKFYNEISIKDIKENVLSKEEIEVKGVFFNNHYYTFYFNNANVSKFKNSLYELFYNKIIENPYILILNGGGGVDVSAAIYFNIKKIDVTENNLEVIELLKDNFSSYTGGIYHNKNVMYYRSEVLPFLIGQNKKYNIIQINDFQDLLNKPLANFSLEYIEIYTKLLEKKGIIYFVLKKWDKYNVSVILNTISTYLNRFRKTLHETVRIIKLNDNNILIFKPEGFNQDELVKINDFCNQNYYDILTIDKFLDKKELKYLPYIEKHRVFPYSIFSYNFKEDKIISKFAAILIIIGIILTSVLCYIIIKKKKSLKNVYTSNLLLYSILSMSGIGLLIPSIFYYIFPLNEDIFLSNSIIFSGFLFFTIILIPLISYKIKLNKRVVIILHSFSLVFLILSFMFLYNIILFIANFGFIKRIILIIIFLSPIFGTVFSARIFSIRWWSKINEKTIYLNWAIMLLVLSTSILIGFVLTFFGNLVVLWVFSILLELLSLITFLKLDYFYKKNNYIYRRYGI